MRAVKTWLETYWVLACTCLSCNPPKTARSLRTCPPTRRRSQPVASLLAGALPAPVTVPAAAPRSSESTVHLCWCQSRPKALATTISFEVYCWPRPMVRGELEWIGLSFPHWLASSSEVARASTTDSVSLCLLAFRLDASWLYRKRFICFVGFWLRSKNSLSNA